MAMRVHSASHSSILLAQHTKNKQTNKKLWISYLLLNFLFRTMNGSPVWGENDRASLLDHAQDAVPQEAPGFGVHPSGWLVLPKHLLRCLLCSFGKRLARKGTQNLIFCFEADALDGYSSPVSIPKKVGRYLHCIMGRPTKNTPKTHLNPVILVWRSHFDSLLPSSIQWISSQSQIDSVMKFGRYVYQ